MSAAFVELPEWGKTLLEGRWLGDDEARAAAARLADEGRLDVRELRTGLELSARSFVGEVALGDLRVRIVPKLSPDALRRLLSFTHGSGVAMPGDSAGAGPAELLAARLLAEVEGLSRWGLGSGYARRSASLAAPRGRLDVASLAARGGLLAPTLPCSFFDRTLDTPLNRALLAGLRAAAAAAPSLAPRIAPAVASLAGLASDAPLSLASLAAVRSALASCDLAYLPALTLIEALLRGQLAPMGALPSGFLFDMNRFFQSIVGRLLRGYLRGVEVHEEWPMNEVLRYAPDANPNLRRPPTPRPDFALFVQGQLAAILDAKYRDLWAEPLPREMLYQLALYAVGHGRSAVIVYPSDDPYAREARVELREPGSDWGFRSVALRPLPLTELSRLLEEPTPAARRKLEALASALATP